jgi:hypothetical protein
MSFDKLPADVQQLCSKGYRQGRWVFLSKDDVDRLGATRQHMIPVAKQYLVMGMHRVLEFVPSENGYFVHTDGGPNEYDREDSAKRWSDYKPSRSLIVEKFDVITGGSSGK